MSAFMRVCAIASLALMFAVVCLAGCKENKVEGTGKDPGKAKQGMLEATGGKGLVPPKVETGNGEEEGK